MMKPDLAGQVLEPGDEEYDDARSVWNAMVDRKPRMIARCADRSDVAAALRFGRERGMEIGVRCGGHSVVGLPMADDALLIDLGAMNGVRVDPQCRRASVQGGALLGALDVAAQRYGLATTAGNVSHTGVGGLTLGGGMGWLARRFGLACDNVVRFEVVTAEGEVVRASEAENPELFWALRGGGGNFGVVTEFEFRLHHIGTETLIADLYVEPQHAAAALRGWRELIAEAPRQATLTAWIGRSRDWAHLPPALRNQRLASIGYVWVGDPEQGRALLPALRAAATPVAERITELSYLQLQRMDDDRQGHRRRRYWKGHYFRALSDEAIDTLVFPRCDSDSLFHPTVSLQSYGGAISDVPDDATAFSHRDVQMEFVAATSWVDPDEDAERMATARQFAAELEGFASGAYVNALSDEGVRGVRRAYPAGKLARITAVKDRYDPDNVFHLNQNIPPSSLATTARSLAA